MLAPMLKCYIDEWLHKRLVGVTAAAEMAEAAESLNHTQSASVKAWSAEL